VVVFSFFLFSDLRLRHVFATLSTAVMQLLLSRCLTRFSRQCDFTTLEEFEKYAEMLLVVRASASRHSLTIVFIFMARISCAPLKR
jgi:hypothetical protein